MSVNGSLQARRICLMWADQPTPATRLHFPGWSPCMLKEASNSIQYMVRPDFGATYIIAICSCILKYNVFCSCELLRCAWRVLGSTMLLLACAQRGKQTCLCTVTNRPCLNISATGSCSTALPAPVKQAVSQNPITTLRKYARLDSTTNGIYTS